MLEVLGDGGDVAVVTDAGTPGISDPGERLVRAVLDAGYEVTTVPGPGGVRRRPGVERPADEPVRVRGVPAPTGRATGATAWPRSPPSGARSCSTRRRTASPRTIADLAAACGPDRPVAVARELTKLYETVVRGTLGDVDLGEPRGEYVVVLGGAPAVEPVVDDDDDRRGRARRAGRRGVDDATRRRVARRLGVARRRAYDIAIARGAERR